MENTRSMQLASILVLVLLSCCESKLFPANDENISYVGRVDKVSSSTWFRFDWSGVEIRTVVHGTASISCLFKDQGGSTFNVFLDDQLISIINTTTTNTTYVVAENLNPTLKYKLLLTKRTEALFGITSFGGFQLEEEGTLSKAFSAGRTIEFIGDSITCGYGDDTPTPNCQFSAATENNYLAYGAVTARSLGADYHIEAWSGKGLVRNYGDKNITSLNPLPSYYPFTLANDRSIEWDFSQWVPDVVVINLGTNDFSTEPRPTQQIFEPAYHKFISYIKMKYANNPKLQMFLVCGPMIGNPCCEYVENVAKSLTHDNVHYIDMQKILSYPVDYGCGGHPSAAGQAKMAAIAEPIIKKVMGW